MAMKAGVLKVSLRTSTTFATNRDVQIAVFVANHLLWQTLGGVWPSVGLPVLARVRAQGDRRRRANS